MHVDEDSDQSSSPVGHASAIPLIKRFRLFACCRYNVKNGNVALWIDLRVVIKLLQVSPTITNPELIEVIYRPKQDIYIVGGVN